MIFREYVFAAFDLGEKSKLIKRAFWLQNNGLEIWKGGEEVLMIDFQRGRRDFLPRLIGDFQAHAQASLRKAGIKIMSANAILVFLEQLRFWMAIVWVARWNGLEILVPKHMWKSKIRLLEQKLNKKRYVTFF